MTDRSIRLDHYSNASFNRGRPRLIEALWTIASALLVASWIPGAMHRRALLRLFGAKIAKGVTIKPGVLIKFPWRLEVGANSWIGERVWIDNLEIVKIGSNCCISQGAYICTGSHDWRSRRFELIVKPVTIEDGAWVAAKAVLAPGLVVGQGAVLFMGSVATSKMEPWGVYQGVPAKLVKSRACTGEV